MKKKKPTTIVICTILAIVLSLYCSLFSGIYAFSDKWVNTYSGEVNKTIKYFMSYDVWTIAENRYSEPIFIYGDDALQLAKTKFSDIFNEVYDLYHKEYNIKKINKHNIATYKKLIEKLETSSNEQQETKDLCIQFLNIYSNNLKKWIYIRGVGWCRTNPN